MKNLLTVVTPGFLCLCATSCSDILFATRTSIGFEVSGDATKAPDHVNFGFRRREFIYMGRDAPKEQSLLGKLDSETSWTKGSAIRETFAGGRAADVVAGSEDAASSAESSPTKQPLTFASRTRIGIGISAGSSEDDAVATGYLGYSRRIATRIKTDPDAATGSRAIPPVLGDVTVHTSGFGFNSETDANGGSPGDILPKKHRLSKKDQGAFRSRIRQTFAIGDAAVDAAGSRQAKIAETLAVESKPKENPER